MVSHERIYQYIRKDKEQGGNYITTLDIVSDIENDQLGSVAFET